jgi:hypothetical protein
MPISFSCVQCGKGYLVGDALAGKKAVCKACNYRMTIPGGSAAAPPASSPRPAAGPSSAPPRPESARPASAPKGDVPVARTVARPASAPKAKPADVPVARVVSKPAEPAHDIYGLDEAPAPLPRLTPRSATAEDATTAEAPAKKKKKKGFFSSGKKKSSGGGSQYSGTGIGGVRLIGIIIGVAAAGFGGWGLLGKSAIEGVIQKVISQTNQAATTLESIRDLPSATAAAPKVRSEIEAIIATLEANKGKKGKKTDIEEVNRRYAPQIEAAFQRLGAAVARVSTIPGAGAAVAIEPLMMRLMAMLQQLDQNA